MSLTSALLEFSSDDLLAASRNLFKDTLQIPLSPLADTPVEPERFFGKAYKEKSHSVIQHIFLTGKITDRSFSETTQEIAGLEQIADEVNQEKDYQGVLIFAVDLGKNHLKRNELSTLTRDINRIFPTPVIVVFKHACSSRLVLSFGVASRRAHLKEKGKHVLGKISMIRDVDVEHPHRGHLDLLNMFSIKNMTAEGRHSVTNFTSFHAALEKIFDVELLNQRFYKELANWYFWALPQVRFPNDIDEDDEKRRATGLIRLLTRVIFCWFIKEKDLIPEKLFLEDKLASVLRNFDPESKKDSSYYQAILQNLFFATLNQRMGKDNKGNAYRHFAKDEGFLKNRTTYDVNNLYRYEKLFQDEDKALSHFADVPFLNGGLFECLDRSNDSGKKIYIDGFSRNEKKHPHIPNHLFFSGEVSGIDLSAVYGDKKRKTEKVSGLLNILNRYKFTIVENTPIDQEIALDPELLGKVFENLLASYNEETKTTARKQTGSFYTPRPIVDYMVDESLKAHLGQALQKDTLMTEADAKAGLDLLIAYTEDEHAFSDKQIGVLLNAIHHCKILDPACGSGAYPMGILHKLVFILTKLDPDNARWKQRQIDVASTIPDVSARNAAIDAIEKDFSENEADYGRKLYLIENCLYGVDIQPIAIQISKLRFFISLVCDQKTNKAKAKNHGIKPLPNLETKFVAANTLIGLPEMDESILIDPRVEQIEREIEGLYHRHFSVQRRDQKLAIRRKVKELRNQLGDILAESLMAPTKARHVAEWDPFEPQASSDFFDPFWMFGVKIFDVVIGNPPWGAKLSKEDKLCFKSFYPEIDSSTPNSFAYFIGAALRQASCSISFVLPDSVLTKDYRKTRELMTPSLTDIAWFLNTGVPESYRQFVYVEHDVCVLTLNLKAQTERANISKQFYDLDKKENVIERYSEAKSNFIFKEHEYCYNLLVRSKEFKILTLLNKHDKLEKIIQVHEGIHTGNSREILFHDHKINDSCHPLYYGGRAGDDINNYQSTPKGWYVDYRSDIIDKSAGYYASLRDERIFSMPKIYVTRTGNPIKAFYDNDTYASNNFFSLQFKNYEMNNEQNLKSILPLILSSLANFYIRTFAAPRLGDTYIETKITHIKRVPISSSILKNSAIFVSLTSMIMTAKKNKLTGPDQFLEDLIDACVMECYFRDHMAERDLLFIDDLAPLLASYDSDSDEATQRSFLSEFVATHIAPDANIRKKLDNIIPSSPDLLAIIKREGQV